MVNWSSRISLVAFVWIFFQCDMSFMIFVSFSEINYHVYRLSCFELRNTPITNAFLTRAVYRHYWIQLVQQFHVLVLGLNILGNPYTMIPQRCSSPTQNGQEPHMVTILLTLPHVPLFLGVRNSSHDALINAVFNTFLLALFISQCD